MEANNRKKKNTFSLFNTFLKLNAMYYAVMTFVISRMWQYIKDNERFQLAASAVVGVVLSIVTLFYAKKIDNEAQIKENSKPEPRPNAELNPAAFTPAYKGAAPKVEQASSSNNPAVKKQKPGN